MGKGLIKGSIFGGIIVFVWMMISWMVLPWHCWYVNSFKDGAAVSAVISEQTTVDGVYVFPGHCEGEKNMDAMKKGPVIFASVQKFGFDVASPKPYVLSFLIQLVGAFLVTLIVMRSSLSHFWGRVGLAGLLGLTVGVLGIFPAWNWWGFSLGYVLVETCDMIIAWTLAGLAIAAVTKR